MKNGPMTEVPDELADGWLPIESAPRDGTLLLLIQPEEGGELIPGLEDDYKWLSPYTFTGWWRDGEWRCAEYSAFDKSPTHWMPIPKPPKNNS